MEVKEIPVRLIKPNPLQTRKNFDKEKLQELGESIKNHGLINPITVQTTPDGYELITGERRLRAAKQIGVESLPAIINKRTKEQASIDIYIENCHREDLDYFERAKAILHIFKARGNCVQNTVIKQLMKLRALDEGYNSQLTDEEKSLQKTCIIIGKKPAEIYRDLKGYFELDKDEHEDENYKKLPKLVIRDIGGIKDKNIRKEIAKKINEEEIRSNGARELIRTIKPLQKEDSEIIDLSKPVHEIKQQSEAIQYIRNIPKEDLDKEVKRFEKVGEALKEAKKIEIEMKKPTKELPPETRASRDAFQNLEVLSTMDGLIKKATCPVCDGGPENLIWECCGLRAMNAADEAEERFKRLLKEARRIKKEEN